MKKAILALLILSASVHANPPIVVGARGQYLGTMSANPYEASSVTNPFGLYGSEYSPVSLSDPYGLFGSPYSTESATNEYLVSETLELEK